MPSNSDSRSSVSRGSRADSGEAFHLKNVERPGDPSSTICSSIVSSQSRAMLKTRRPAADICATEACGEAECDS